MGQGLSFFLCVPSVLLPHCTQSVNRRTASVRCRYHGYFKLHQDGQQFVDDFLEKYDLADVDGLFTSVGCIIGGIVCEDAKIYSHRGAIKVHLKSRLMC